MGKPIAVPTKLSLAGRRPYWTAEEDAQLVRLVKKYGTKNWGLIAKELKSPIPRKGKSCRSRWMHQLNPNIKHEPFSMEEEKVLIRKQREFGNKWSRIASFLPGRTDNAIKNHWHGHVKRRLIAQGYSSDEEEFEVELRSQVVPAIRSRADVRLRSDRNAQKERECARILLEMSQSKSHRETFSDCRENEDLIQPDQQRILCESLESAGLSHYPVLPLCPIKEEDINNEQHVVIVLQSADKKEVPARKAY